MSLFEKYTRLYSKVLKNEVIDSSSYFEFYTFQLLKDTVGLKKMVKIKSNQKIKDGLPISHAPPGPDIEVFGNKIAYIFECSLKLGTKQFDDEHESVSRHYEEFYNRYRDRYNQILCFFIAPKISKELSEWYFSLFSEIKIIPLDLETFILFMINLSILEVSKYEKKMFDLLQKLNEAKTQKDWEENITKFINQKN